MSRIHIITASAGSGKTYRLTELLEEKISSGTARPEAVMATTFTRKAAAELQERVRQRLMAQGLFNQAHRLFAARLGTINAICGRLVNEFAFEKGLFPDAGVLDENAALRELRRSISRVATMEQTSRLAELESLLGGFEWTKAVENIITLARYNDLDANALEQSKKLSMDSMTKLLGQDLPEGRDLDQELVDALQGFVQSVDTDHDDTNATRNALETARFALNTIQQGRRLKWSVWRKLGTLSPGKKSAHHAHDLIRSAAEHDRHPELKRDLTQAVALVFDIAIQTLCSYQEHKRLWGVLDFADQETMALELLDRSDVRDHLSERLDVLLVDEFQDTSPIQLAVLLKLASLSKETVWVGDQKQSIYGFRGTDPALMDACLEELLQPSSSNTLETLERSWRSRPPLVRLTSDVFSPAFAQHGIPEERIRLDPALGDEPDLGPAVEWWTLQSKNQAQDAMALAQGVRDFLNDEKAKVRDKQSNTARQVRPGDVAVLCRTNDMCRKVAEALKSVDIRAAIPSSGLLDTPEAQAFIAGLRLWVDSRDSLAAAELARLLHYPEQPEQWLQDLLEPPGENAFTHLPEAAAITELSRQHPAAGVQQSLTLVCQALHIREWCLAWGESDQRLANLDALQAMALNFIDSCYQEGIGCTPAGFIAHLRDLHQAGEDTRNPAGGENAVTVATWHSAKGLEWPVTILYQLGKTFDPDPLGVQVLHDWNEFTIQDPLADRKLRYWISPYDPRTKYSAFHDSLREHPSMEETARQHYRQELRLLYVGWTRARDRLVLAGREPEFQKGILSMLQDKDGSWLLSYPEGEQATWAGRTFDIKTRELEPAEPEERTITPGEDYTEAQPTEHPPASLAPSDMTGQGQVLHLEQIGSRLSLSGDPDLNALGEAMHTFFAADRLEYEQQIRLKLATDTLTRWECGAYLAPVQMVGSADSLYDWIQNKYPHATWKRELPVMNRQENGTQVFGFIDLLLETQHELVIVDHKVYPGGKQEMHDKSQEFMGQLAAYKQGLKALDPSKSIACYLHYPVVGCVAYV